MKITHNSIFNGFALSSSTAAALKKLTFSAGLYEQYVHQDKILAYALCATSP